MPRQLERNKKILDWEELENAPNTLGAYSFLRPTAEIISIRDGRGIPLAQIAEPSLYGGATPEIERSGAQSVTVPDQTRSRPYKVHACSLVQHGHSLGETALYKALWDAGERQADDTRVITIGWKTMAHLANLSDKSAKRNMKSLIEKLAIEQIAGEVLETSTGRTYRVYSFAQILEKRKGAGMLWSKWDKGRRFVQQNGSPLVLPPNSLSENPRGVAPVDKTTSMDKPSIEAMDKTTIPPMDVLSSGAGDVLSPPLRSLLRKQQGIKTSSSERQSIVQAIAQYGTPDDQAADQLWRACLVVCPDATVDEIVTLIDEKGRQIARNRSVKNPIGFLLTAVPKCFRPESIAVLRQQRERVLRLEADRKEGEKRQEREYIEMLKANHEKYLAISLDPSAPQEKRKNAESMLADILTALENAQRRAAESMDAEDEVTCA